MNTSEVRLYDSVGTYATRTRPPAPVNAALRQQYQTADRRDFFRKNPLKDTGADTPEEHNTGKHKPGGLLSNIPIFD